MDNLILNGRYIVYVFIIISWFQVKEKQVLLFFCQPMMNVDYVSGNMSQGEQFLADVFHLGGLL